MSADEAQAIFFEDCINMALLTRTRVPEGSDDNIKRFKMKRFIDKHKARLQIEKMKDMCERLLKKNDLRAFTSRLTDSKPDSEQRLVDVLQKIKKAGRDPIAELRDAINEDSKTQSIVNILTKRHKSF